MTIILLLAVSVYLFTFPAIKAHYLRTLETDLSNFIKALNLKIIPLCERKQYQELDLLVKNLDRETNTRITVVDSNGEVLADSETDPGTMENHRNRPEISKALKG